MSGPNRRWEGRRFSETERLLAYQRILEGRSYVEIAAELDCSPKLLYRQFGAQKERARRTCVTRSPLASPSRRKHYGTR